MEHSESWVEESPELVQYLPAREDLGVALLLFQERICPVTAHVMKGVDVVSAVSDENDIEAGY